MIPEVPPDPSLGWVRESFNIDSNPFMNATLDLGRVGDPDIQDVRAVEDVQIQNPREAWYWTKGIGWDAGRSEGGYYKALEYGSSASEMAFAYDDNSLVAPDPSSGFFDRFFPYDGTTCIHETEIHIPEEFSFKPHGTYGPINIFSMGVLYMGLTAGYKRTFDLSVQYLAGGGDPEGFAEWVYSQFEDGYGQGYRSQVVAVGGSLYLTEADIIDIESGLDPGVIGQFEVGDAVLNIVHSVSSSTSPIQGDPPSDTLGTSIAFYRIPRPCDIRLGIARNKNGFYCAVEGGTFVSAIVGYFPHPGSPSVTSTNSLNLTTTELHNASLYPDLETGMWYIPVWFVLPEASKVFTLVGEIGVNYFNMGFRRVDGSSGFRVGRIGLG